MINLQVLKELTTTLEQLLLLLGVTSSLVSPAPVLGSPLGAPLWASQREISMTVVQEKPDRFEVPFTQKLSNEGETKVEMMKSDPKIIFSRWNGEAQLGIAYTKITANAQKLVSSNVIKWGAGQQLIHAYKKNEDQFEIELELKSKPNTNVFEFTIDGWENFDFFKQTSLVEMFKKGELNDLNLTSCTETQCYDEKGERTKLDTKYVNSISIYHKTKVFQKEGGINYGTGKIGSLERIIATDDLGNWIYGDQNFINGKLYITVPQEFLDNATYPVIIDPTLGYTSIGAVSDNSGPNNWRGSTWTAVEDGTITSMTHYHNAREHPARLVVYDVTTDYNTNATLVASTAQATTTNALGWETYSATGTITSGNDYHLLIYIGSPGTLYDYWDNTGGISTFDPPSSNPTFPTLPNPWGYTAAQGTRRMSLYLTYTAGGGGGTAPKKVIPPRIIWLDE